MESSLEVKKTATTVKQEPLETSSPLLASMISTAPNPPPTSPHALNYLTLLGLLFFVIKLNILITFLKI